MLFASVDLGTNTFRLLIAEIKHDCTNFLLRKSIITGLGKDYDINTHMMSEVSIQNAISAIVDFSNILSEYKINDLRIVATSVVREAYNSYMFIEPAQKLLNHQIDVISGQEEARLTVMGVLNSVHYTGNKLIIDIGGGSTEFIFVNSENNIEFLKSTDIGVLKYSNKYDLSKKLNENQVLTIYKDIELRIKECCCVMSDITIDSFKIVATAGTPTTLAAIDMSLIDYDHELVNNYILSKENIISIIYKLVQLDSEQRLNITGMHPGRENLLIPGAFMLQSLLEYYKKNEIIVSDGGLLEGILYNKLKSGYELSD